jgi:CubicO group peptidase (beta-lactamase class C family)
MTNSIIKSNGALTALLTITLFSIASAQTSAANAQSDITIRVDQLFGRFDRPDSPGCALGVIKDGKLIYKKGYGMANLEHDIRVLAKTSVLQNTAWTPPTLADAKLYLRDRKNLMALDLAGK